MQATLPRPPIVRRLLNSASAFSRLLGILGLFVVAGLFAGAAAVLPPQIGVAVPATLVLGVLVLRVAWRRPEIGMVILVVGLPFQQLILARAFAWGVDSRTLGLARFWKEALLLTLLAKAVSSGITLSRVDRFAALYLAVTAAYLAIPIGPNTPYVKSIAAREIAAFVLVFLAAKHLPWSERSSQIVGNAVLVAGVILAVLAFWNHFEPESWARWLDSTRLTDYRSTLIDAWNIPPPVTYTVLAGRSFVRAGSLLGYLSLPYYLAIPVGIALARGVAGRASRLAAFAGVICAGGILVTITRSAIVIAPIIVFLAFWLARRKVQMIVLIGVGTLVLLPVAASLSLGSHLSGSFDTSSGSTSIHAERLEESNENLFENPGGSGLGTSAATAQRFSVSGAIINESWYFQIGTDMGFAGMIAYILFLLAALWELFLRARSGSVAALGSLLGLTWIALGGIVLHTLNDLSVAWSIWLLAGLALRKPLDRASPEAASDPESHPAVAAPAAV